MSTALVAAYLSLPGVRDCHVPIASGLAMTGGGRLAMTGWGRLRMTGREGARNGIRLRVIARSPSTEGRRGDLSQRQTGLPGRDCHAEFVLSGMRFFALLRMTGREGLAMTGWGRLRMTGREGLAVTWKVRM